MKTTMRWGQQHNSYRSSTLPYGTYRTVTYGTVHTSYNGGALATFNLISISGILADENTGIEEMQDRKLATK